MSEKILSALDVLDKLDKITAGEKDRRDRVRISYSDTPEKDFYAKRLTAKEWSAKYKLVAEKQTRDQAAFMPGYESATTKAKMEEKIKPRPITRRERDENGKFKPCEAQPDVRFEPAKIRGATNAKPPTAPYFRRTI